MRKLFCALVVCCFFPVANASTFRVDYAASLTIAGDLFGLPDGSTQPLSATFIVDTEAAPVLFAPAGTLVGGAQANALPLRTDIYGFSIGAISDLSVSLGGQSVVPMSNSGASFGKVWPAGTPFAADLFVDQPLSDGATPNIWMVRQYGSTDGYFQLGGAACGSDCALIAAPQVADYLGLGNSRVVAGSESIIVSAVPLPGALWLLVSGLIGFLGVGARRTWRAITPIRHAGLSAGALVFRDS